MNDQPQSFTFSLPPLSYTLRKPLTGIAFAEQIGHYASLNGLQLHLGTSHCVDERYEPLNIDDPTDAHNYLVRLDLSGSVSGGPQLQFEVRSTAERLDGRFWARPTPTVPGYTDFTVIASVVKGAHRYTPRDSKTLSDLADKLQEFLDNACEQMYAEQLRRDLGMGATRPGDWTPGAGRGSRLMWD